VRGDTNFFIMSKVEKKRKKLEARLEQLENEMYQNLKQKTSNTAEISLSDYQNKIAAVRQLLKDLK
jgi:hypothetical protein